MQCYFFPSRIILQLCKEEFKGQSNAVSLHIFSKYSKEMATKSEVVNKLLRSLFFYFVSMFVYFWFPLVLYYEIKTNWKG